MTDARTTAETVLTDAELEVLAGTYAGANNINGKQVHAVTRELQANRRGEFICSRCYLRKDADVSGVSNEF